MVRTRIRALRAALVVLVACGLPACGGSPPIQPTPLVLAITCPATINAQSDDGRQIQVTFTASTVNGQMPVTTTCSPASGSNFPVGTTSVTCQARDAGTQSASCSFNVVVQGPPRLTYTRFMAFGDSLTAGVISLAPFTLSLDLPGSYPSALRNLLRQHYPQQSMTVINAGNPGELASDEGLRRFRPELLTNRPEVVLLMEGTNDLLNRQPGAHAALAALDTMITEAESQNVRVCLATIPPQRGGGIPDRTAVAAMIPDFNDQIRALAERRRAVLIDVYAGMKDDLSLIGRDNLHPTAMGYEVMANIVEQAIARAFTERATPYDARSVTDLPASRTMRSSGATR